MYFYKWVIAIRPALLCVMYMYIMYMYIMYMYACKPHPVHVYMHVQAVYNATILH